MSYALSERDPVCLICSAVRVISAIFMFPEGLGSLVKINLTPPFWGATYSLLSSTFSNVHWEGTEVGVMVGVKVGSGMPVGANVGSAVGATVGIEIGSEVGTRVGSGIPVEASFVETSAAEVGVISWAEIA